MLLHNAGRSACYLARTLFHCVLVMVLLPGTCSATQDGEEGLVVPWDSQPVWSPDGTQIAFVSTSNAPDGRPDGPTNIWVVKSDGTNLRQLTFDGNNEYPTWSPDGSAVAFQAGAQIWQVGAATGTITHITDGVRGGFAPDWHPTDAARIATWFKTVGHDNNLMVVNPQTCMTQLSGRVTLLRRDGADTTPRWSRNGTRIAFVGEVEDPVSGETEWYLMTVNAEGTNLHAHSAISRWTTRLSWFPDGNRIVDDKGNIHNLTTGAVTSLFGERVKQPDISRDGQRVTYAEFVGLEGQFIFVRNTDGTGKQQITRIVSQPALNPDEGTYDTAQTVTISCSTTGATIRYTTDGTDPTETSTQYTAPITIDQTKTLKARAWKTDYFPSAVKTAEYTMKAATPTFNPDGGTYTGTQNVTMSCTTPDVTIRYTTDGTEPTGSSTQYTSPVAVSTNTTLKAKAFKTGWTTSDTKSADYVIQ